MPFHIDYRSISEQYAKEQPKGTLYLAFRDIASLLAHYLPHSLSYIQALDFGCGTGVSTRFLKSLSPVLQKTITVEGADISPEMLKCAQKDDPNGIYRLIENKIIPVPNHYYDLVFSTFVLFEFANSEEMAEALQDVKRVMKEHAVLIAVTGSPETYQEGAEWVSLKTDFSQNRQLKSGDLARVDFIVDQQTTLTFNNYYWTEEDYSRAFTRSGFTLLEILKPLGTAEEAHILSWQWKSETILPPYYTFILSKNKAG